MGVIVRDSRRAAVALAALLAAGSSALPAAWGQNSDAGGSIRDAARAFVRGRIEASLQTMNRPFPPFRVIGNISYVGASDTAVYLVTTPEGHILINSGFAETLPLIRESLHKLGFRLEDVKVLLACHAHLDHVGGHAAIRRLTGAKIVMSRQDAEVLARGGRGDFLPTRDDVVDYPPARADRIVEDGQTVELGGLVLTAHLTPGHTRGCTTWTMTVDDAGTRRDVVFHGGTTILPGVRLVDNPKYPAIVADYERTFRVLEGLPCDVFLAPHGSQFGLVDKHRRLEAGEQPNPFIDPEGYRSFVKAAHDAFNRQLGRKPSGTAPRAGAGSVPTAPQRKES
jgi:metallo-beta-lactamase class B